MARSSLVPLEMGLDMTFSTLDFPADFEIQSFAKHEWGPLKSGSDGTLTDYQTSIRLVPGYRIRD